MKFQAECEKPHFITLLKWLVNEVRNSCGDGDALLYLRSYSIDDVLPIVEEVNKEIPWPWIIERNGDTINWYDGQEGMTITTDEQVYKNAPHWQQVLIRW